MGSSESVCVICGERMVFGRHSCYAPVSSDSTWREVFESIPEESGQLVLCDPAFGVAGELARSTLDVLADAEAAARNCQA